MKKYLFVILSIIILPCLLTSCKARKARLEAQAAREKFVNDSIMKEYFVRDSIRKRTLFVKDSIAKREKFVADSIKEVQNTKDIARLSKLFRKKRDEFSNCTWIIPYSSPNGRGANAIYCYFETDNGYTNNFRFVFQYYSDQWLFIDDLIFNIDGCNYCITPSTWKHDTGYGMVAEWCDEPILYEKSSESRTIDENLIKAICNGKVVKIKMNGSNYYDTRTMTATQKKSIKDTYEYYKLLGGTFRTH